MAVDRPTFSENWYRVAELKPRLRANVQTYRQHYRGNMWYVVRDQSANQFFRLNDAAFHFVGLLDGNHTIAQAWDICNEALGDRAPTQGEAIQLLGQLYTSNLLHGDMPADATGMFDRYHKRMSREIRGYFMNMMFIRIPMFDPERILEQWHKIFGWFFGWFGFLVWAIVCGVGAYHVLPHLDSLLTKAMDPQTLLDSDNLLLLYCSFGLIKLIHEFGHGFACKRFGKVTGSGGEVHTMGIMLLVFMPVPYVDASSSWAFRSRWHRAFVGAAGMYVELFVASIFAVIWANTNEGLLNALSYNVMFIASVSTLLFNGNPLLRYDGYYILSDLLEIPNLSQRGKDYFYYLVKKYIYFARNPRNPAHSIGERIWMLIYWAASTVYRVFICAAILLYIADVLPFIGFVLAAGAVATWVLVPLFKYVKYLATSPEIARTRMWSNLVTLAFFVGLFGLIGLYPWPDRDRAEGVLESREIAIVHMSETGFIEKALPSNSIVKKGDVILQASNIELEAEKVQLDFQLNLTQVRLAEARKEDPAQVQILNEQLKAVQGQLENNQKRRNKLSLIAAFDGVWIAPDIDQMNGAFVQRGERLGVLANTSDMITRIITDQSFGPRLTSAYENGEIKEVEMRLKGYPDALFKGVIEKVSVSGDKNLPTQGVSIMAGSTIEIDTEDPNGMKAAENIFEVKIRPVDLPKKLADKLMLGQRVVARFELPEIPLGTQWYRMVRQVVQRRFQI